MKRSFVFLLAFAGHLGFAMPSNIDSERIETIVVTASRLDYSKKSLTSSVDVIASDEIEGRNPASVTELLRQFSGVNVTQQGGRGGVTGVLVRGGESNFTVVMVDGVKMNDSTNTRGGSYDLSNLDLGNVNRVELVRGPLSSIYGSDAMAGVINIITTDWEPGGRLWFQAGSCDFVSASGGFSKLFASTIASVDLHALRDNTDVEGASYQDWGLSGGLRSELGEGASASVLIRYRQSKSTSFPEDSGGPEFAAIRDVDSRDSSEGHLRFAWDQALSSGWRFNAAGSRYERGESFWSPGIAPGLFAGVPPNSADTEFSRDQVVVALKRRSGLATSFAVGAEWQRENGNSVGMLDLGGPVASDFQLKRDSIGAFAEIGVDVGPLTLQSGLRWDDINAIDNETTARIGVLYRLSDGQTDLRVNWGQGFKAPSFFALAHPLVGNPALHPEFANSVDLMLIRRFARPGSELRLSLYRNDYKGLIDFDPDLFRTVNRSKVVAQGIELDLALPMTDRLDLRGHLTHSDSDITDSDAVLRGRPKWRGGIVVDWAINGRWRLLSSFLILSEFFESSIPTGSILLDGYERVDVSATWQASDKLSLQFAVDNLLDKNYHEAVGFPGAGIRGRIGVRYTF